MRFKEQTESPQIVGDVDWNLSVEEDNRERATGFSDQGVELFKNYPTGKLLIRRTTTTNEIGLISKITGLLEYYVQFEENALADLGTCATQVKLWRSPDATVAGISRYAFDQILLGRYDSVVSYTAHSARGIEFWRTLLGSYSSLKSVGLLDGTAINVFDDSVPIARWVAAQNGWGKYPTFRNKRFFISNKDPATLRQPVRGPFD